MAVEKGFIDVVLLLLRTGKADPYLTDSANKSALMLAVENKHKEVVEALLGVGSACTDAMAENGDTALFLAVVRRDVDITRILLEIGMANSDLGCDSPFKYPLPYAVENNYQDIVQILLSAGKADPIPGLQAAISKNQIATIRSFLGIAGVDPNTQDRVSGQTVLIAAIRAQDLQFVQALLENKMVDINAQNWAGGTALMLAVWFKDLDAEELLVEYGADPNPSLRSWDGDTLLDLADQRGVKRLLFLKKVRTV
ncbi:ankyrin repeat-containing domain protein [Aspergillus arachidicola]|uniref:Ankyrin repeat-containing domain protein n=1 Tax=Aspergillus arachidicola TaxID=656916 RepID=A0A5N6Y8Y6_9EURO|nr:ankyrin repeat-containing domain protein [Aspergillus arachidicola]